ncbi:MAG: HEPN domain containing protein [Dehalococcoidia bacterium]|nr:HEPN domain containing protein [Dehalococcoidia bacterium]
MPGRQQDWLRQAIKDLEHAESSVVAGDYEWACFAAHQSAEKAVKAVFQKIGAEAWGHSITELLEKLPGKRKPALVLDASKELDRHYIGARYPDFLPTGAPADYYTKKDAKRAIKNAETVFNFCKDILLS